MYPIERHARILSLVVFLQAGGSPGYRRRMFSRVLRPRRRAARTAAFWQRRRLHQARLAPVHGKAPRGGYQVPGASARGRGSAIVQGATTNDRVFHCRSVGGEFGGGGDAPGRDDQAERLPHFGHISNTSPHRRKPPRAI